MTRKTRAAAIGLLILALGGLGAYTAINRGGDSGVNREGNSSGTNVVETPEIKQIVDQYSSGVLTAKSASIDSKKLTVKKEDGTTLTYGLPKDEFFLSVAPYMKSTHPCATHNLAGCQGELANKEFTVTAVNADGKIVLNETVKSHVNGFIDLWLPRDQTYRLTIGYNGKTAESEVSTYEKNDTCLTTMQLG
ncbi:CueP family metal-binding protein [Paenibacillus sp. HN-1]|uniref:CueP family metal-binding protein n=1 Tax=Paenibacillus TaxID=44249 RepID=UPI001CA7F4C1|nr:MULTISPECIES: CueP family metal-binding protein [Paenibacillus]MBY9081124.1 CueP family metal-binding protein [Paenibacillus sp. CGMCC 1.18879]MBY9087161.1 CueP family metal-binding protein [Paenibacillus sinensis]